LRTDALRAETARFQAKDAWARMVVGDARPILVARMLDVIASRIEEIRE
jgi:hypothetical protein